MCKKRFNGLIRFSLLWMCLSPLAPVRANQPESTIWLISDIHHISPTLYDEGEYFQHMQATAGGMDLLYSSQRLEALIMQIQRQQPDILLVSGDLTLNGEYQSMLELADSFAQIEALGTDVYVIPGNHDISNGWASHFTGDTLVRVQQVLPADFREIFSEYGYEEALSLDEASLSYITEPVEGLVLLMIDSNIYQDKQGEGPPLINGELKVETKDWLWHYLENNTSESDRVLPILHHNVLMHFDDIGDGYTLDNAEELHTMLQHYQIPLALSGHTHAQHIAAWPMAEDYTLTEILTGAFSLYPSAIGELQLNKAGSLKYQQLTLEVSEWAQATQQTNEDILNYSTYMQELLLDYARTLATERILNQAVYDESSAALIIDLFAQVNLAVFAGNLSEIWPDLNANFQQFTSLLEPIDGGFFSDYLLEIVESRSGSHQTFELD